MKNKAILHNLNEASKEEFDTLAAALVNAWDSQATGYIVDPGNNVINIKKGKRKGLNNKWIPCITFCNPPK